MNVQRVNLLYKESLRLEFNLKKMKERNVMIKEIKFSFVRYKT